ncbi:MAG: hypothetical protein Ct9H90mP10_08070 [Actinomycetota bacterium]|nr:MAG: hypothetical protein Ct9H90mP10_08070 [Actinomycetota bacterium]
MTKQELSTVKTITNPGLVVADVTALSELLIQKEFH